MSNILPDLYIVEKILNKRIRKGVPEYFVKWENYPSSQNTWEPINNLETVLHMVDEFEENLKNKKIEKNNSDSMLRKKIRHDSKRNDISNSESNEEGFNSSKEISKIGSFRDDIPNCILKASIISIDNKELNCCVDWIERTNGIKPEPTWVSSRVLLEKSPSILCEFLMKHIKFPMTK